MALERLQTYLIDELKSLENTYHKESRELVKDNPKTLSWTGETINLVEFGYGIWLTGQIKYGNASITEIIQWLEAHFNVKIGKAHRRWQSIMSRKRVPGKIYSSGKGRDIKKNR
ncbi:MAG: RteC protein [Mucilaginibacter sp.]|nr:RteC protein [Mucilaginibacter sp.]